MVRSVCTIEGQGEVCGVTHTPSGDLDTLIEAVILNCSTLGRGDSVQRHSGSLHLLLALPEHVLQHQSHCLGAAPKEGLPGPSWVKQAPNRCQHPPHKPVMHCLNTLIFSSVVNANQNWSSKPILFFFLLWGLNPRPCGFSYPATLPALINSLISEDCRSFDGQNLLKVPRVRRNLWQTRSF